MCDRCVSQCLPTLCFEKVVQLCVFSLVVENPGLQSNIINELLLATKDVGAYVETFSRLLQEFERRCMIR